MLKLIIQSASGAHRRPTAGPDTRQLAGAFTYELLRIYFGDSSSETIVNKRLFELDIAK